MPRGAAAELGALDEDDIALAELGQVIRRRASDDSAADHDDLGVRRKLVGHPHLSFTFFLARATHMVQMIHAKVKLYQMVH
jgi:hypothetical protein